MEGVPGSMGGRAAGAEAKGGPGDGCILCSAESVGADKASCSRCDNTMRRMCIDQRAPQRAMHGEIRKPTATHLLRIAEHNIRACERNVCNCAAFVSARVWLVASGSCSGRARQLTRRHSFCVAVERAKSINEMATVGLNSFADRRYSARDLC